MKIRTVVVDDEKPARDRIKRFLGEHPDFEVVGEAGDGKTAVRVIVETRPDLVFLDVRMPEGDGFEVLERLGGPLPRVVFATAYERYAVQAFEVNSIDYLLKPFDRKRFAAAIGRVREEMRKNVPSEQKLDALLEEIRESTAALRRAAAIEEGAPPSPSPSPSPSPERAAGGAGRGESSPPNPSGASPSPRAASSDRLPAGERELVREGTRGEADDEGETEDFARPAAGPGPGLRPPPDRIPGKRGPKIYLLAPAEILWFEADGELVLARSGAHRYIVSRTLTELEETLDPKIFFRSHRSFIVNLAAIGEIVPEESGNYRIVMRDPERTAVPLSRRQARKLRDVFPW